MSVSSHAPISVRECMSSYPILIEDLRSPSTIPRLEDLIGEEEVTRREEGSICRPLCNVEVGWLKVWFLFGSQSALGATLEMRRTVLKRWTSPCACRMSSARREATKCPAASIVNRSRLVGSNIIGRASRMWSESRVSRSYLLHIREERLDTP